MAFAAAALFFGATDNAFAHPAHHHAQQTQHASAVNFEIAAPIADHVIHADEFVSAAEMPMEKCQHGNQTPDCDSCCACSASASVALVTPDYTSSAPTALDKVAALAVAYQVRQPVLDLSRPPKSFA